MGHNQRATPMTKLTLMSTAVFTAAVDAGSTPAKGEKPVKVDNRAYYRDAFLAKWLADVCGPAPALATFDVVHAIADKRQGVEALHIAMCLRPNGCTVREFQVAGNCGPASNYRRELQTVAKVITVTKLPGDGKRAYRFKAYLTAKGVKLCEAAGITPPKGAVKADGDAPAKAPRRRVSKAKVKATPDVGHDPAPHVPAESTQADGEQPQA